MIDIADIKLNENISKLARASLTPAQDSIYTSYMLGVALTLIPHTMFATACTNAVEYAKGIYKNGQTSSYKP